MVLLGEVSVVSFCSRNHLHNSYYLKFNWKSVFYNCLNSWGIKSSRGKWDKSLIFDKNLKPKKIYKNYFFLEQFVIFLLNRNLTWSTNFIFSFRRKKRPFKYYLIFIWIAHCVTVGDLNGHICFSWIYFEIFFWKFVFLTVSVSFRVRLMN